MSYSNERDFLLHHIPHAFNTIAAKEPEQVRQKSAHDLVTEVDIRMEKYLSDAIRQTFPGDRIHGEELSSSQTVDGRTWTIDPIDGTYNMARQLPLYGVQCALIENGEPVVCAIYLPFHEGLLYAVKGEGSYCNGRRLQVNTKTPITNAIVSFGDYTRKNQDLAKRQHTTIGRLYHHICKIRMFGAACLDFTRVALGQTDSTSIITKNIWDVAPGILLCREAGATVTNIDGQPYRYTDDGVTVSATKELSALMAQCFRKNVWLRTPSGQKQLVRGCLFDFDGVVVDTESYHFKSWNYGAKPLGTQLTWQEYLPLKSTGGTKISRYIMEKAQLTLPVDEMLQIAVRKDENFVELMKSLTEKDILPGIVDFLCWLRQCGIKTAVASSSTASNRIAAGFGLDKYFDAMFDGNTKMPRKPAPDVFLTAANAIGAEPNDCVVFEDSLAGIDAAVNAGMRVIAVGGIRSEKAIAHIQDFSEIGTLFYYE